MNAIHIRVTAQRATKPQPCEETTVADIETTKQLIKDLEDFAARLEVIAHSAGDDLNEGADCISGHIKMSLDHARLVLRGLEGER